MTMLWAFIVAIAVLVVFHELGHYWVARRCGVKVLRFSVGFGKVIYSKRFAGSETEWVISAIPLGGYVKMLDEREGVVEKHELHRAFNRQPVLRRMAIVVAGPVANLLLAIILYWGMFMHGVPGLKPVLGQIAANTPAAAAQMQAQETILSIQGEPMAGWQDVRWAVLHHALQASEVRIEGRTQQGQLLQHTLDLQGLAPADLDGDFLPKLGLEVYQPPIYPVIGQVIAGGAAERAGLRADDRIQSVNGTELALWKDWVEWVRSHPAQPLHLEVVRAGHLLQMDITPDAIEEAGKQIGRIGAAPYIDAKLMETMRIEVSYGPIASLGQALHRTWETTTVSLQLMGRMIMGQISLKNLSGPITIADYAGQSAQMGLVAYIGFLALISISLGVLNLMPVPLLDGGHLLYYTVELFKGSPVSEKAWEIGQRLGIVLLASMMALALYNDISRLILG